MPTITDLTRITAQDLFDFHYSDDSSIYLLIDDTLRLVENIQHHTVNGVYIGGGYDVLLEGDDEYRYIDKYDAVYLDEHCTPINSIDDDTDPATEQGLIDALLNDADEWTLTTEAHALPPDVEDHIPSGVVMWQPGDPSPDLRFTPKQVELSEGNKPMNYSPDWILDYSKISLDDPQVTPDTPLVDAMAHFAPAVVSGPLDIDWSDRYGWCAMSTEQFMKFLSDGTDSAGKQMRPTGNS